MEDRSRRAPERPRPDRAASRADRRPWLSLALALLTLAAALPAAPSDLSARAAAALEEGDRLGKAGTAESTRAALARFEEARELYRQAGDAAGEARALQAAGLAHGASGEPRLALDAYLAAAAAAERAGDRAALASALVHAGGARLDLGDLREAVATLARGVPLVDAERDPGMAAHALHTQAAAHEQLGEFQRALEVYGRALDLVRRQGERRGEAAILNNLGTIHYELGDPAASLARYEQSLAIRRELGDRAGEARALANTATMLDELGRREEALARYEQSLDLARAAGERRAEANALASLGQLTVDLGRPREALPLLDRALALARELGTRRIEATAVEQRGKALAALGEMDAARASFGEALALLHTAGQRRRQADLLGRIADLERRRGRLAEARAAIEEALALLESLRTETTRQELRTSFFAAKRGFYDLHVALLVDLHRREPEAGHAAAALAAAERARARSLLDLLAEARTDVRRGVDPALLARERELAERLAARERERLRLASGTADPDALAALQAEIDELLARQREVEGSIRFQSPAYAALTRPEPLDAAGVQALLDDDTALLEYSLGAERGALWVVTRSALALVELPPRAEVDAAALRLSEALTARNRRPDGETAEARGRRLAAADAALPGAARDLARLVLDPAAGLLAARRLVVVPEGALQYLPFALLPEPGSEEPLLARHEVVGLPSASALAALRRDLGPRPPAGRLLAVVADPVFSGVDPRVPRLPGAVAEPGSRFQRLRFSRAEAEGIAALAPAAERLVALDHAAGKELATGGGLGGYRLVHLATHAVIDDRRPELSGLVLTLVDEQGRPKDGTLRLQDVYDLELGADLVTLSACETALGRDVRGEGLVGLVRGFMYAGAPRVVASLWSVDDRATAELMRRFYRGLLEEARSPAAALAEAQRALAAQPQWASPYFWAAFVLQGEWRPAGAPFGPADMNLGTSLPGVEAALSSKGGSHAPHRDHLDRQRPFQQPGLGGEQPPG